jgi:tetratricopeptide (TPR) repeat protein
LFEQIDSDHGRAHTENHLGVLYLHRRRWQQAKRHLEQALGLWQAMGDTHGLMRVFINFSALYSKMEQPERALECSYQALHQAQITGAETAIGSILINIAIAHRKIGSLDKAEEHAWQAEKIFRRFSNQTELTGVWNTLGLIFIEQRRWEDAHHYLQLSLELSHHLHYKYAEIETLIGLVKYELARRNRRRAAIQLKKLDVLINQHFRGSDYRRIYTQLLTEYHNLSSEIQDLTGFHYDFAVNQPLNLRF